MQLILPVLLTLRSIMMQGLIWKSTLGIIWERGFKGSTELKWISNQKAVTKKTLKNTAKVKELKEQVDALMKVEVENTATLKANPSYLPIPVNTK